MSKLPKTPIARVSDQFADAYNNQNEVIRNLFAKRFAQTCMQPIKEIQDGIIKSQTSLKGDFNTFLREVRAIIRENAIETDKFYRELVNLTPLYEALQGKHAALEGTYAALEEKHAALEQKFAALTAANSDKQSQLDAAKLKIEELSSKLELDTGPLNGLTKETDLEVEEQTIDDLTSYLNGLRRKEPKSADDVAMIELLEAEIAKLATPPGSGGSRRRRRRQVKRSRRN